jgi:outer membrane protein assembly factor BamB
LVGDGSATPLIIRDTVFVFTRQAGHEMLIAIDANTGKERRRSSYPAPYSPGHPAAAHGAGPKATPLYHEGTVFTLGVSGIASAFDAATGTRLWQTPPAAEQPYFSAAASLAGDSGLVIGHPGDSGPLTAFDSKTGEIKWTAGTAGFFASPDHRLDRRTSPGRDRDSGQHHRRRARWARSLALSLGGRKRIHDTPAQWGHDHRECHGQRRDGVEAGGPCS